MTELLCAVSAAVLTKPAKACLTPPPTPGEAGDGVVQKTVYSPPQK